VKLTTIPMADYCSGGLQTIHVPAAPKNDEDREVATAGCNLRFGTRFLNIRYVVSAPYLLPLQLFIQGTLCWRIQFSPIPVSIQIASQVGPSQRSGSEGNGRNAQRSAFAGAIVRLITPIEHCG
jgi:hypothetical protein